MYKMAEYAKNKKALFDYEKRQNFEAGISLAGYEVKSIKSGGCSLDGSYVIIRGGEAFLTGAHISPYQPSNMPRNYDPARARKLLLSKKEIAVLADAEKSKGLTIIPVSMYSKNNKIKVEIWTARGKKKYDKRQDIKKRDVEKELKRNLKT